MSEYKDTQDLGIKSDIWIEEKTQDSVAMRWRVKNVLFSGKSEFQAVDVVESVGHGKMLFNDGLVMVSERDEFIYHDMIAHVPLFIHPNPKKVLVIGGGDGGTAREVMRHDSVEECHMVEIDEMVVDACKEHIPQTSCSFDHPKMTLTIGDGVQFVKDTNEKYDVILVDSTDPIGPATPLFGEEFYQDVYNALSEDGIVVSQGESPFFEVKMQSKLLSILNGQFPIVSIYNFNNLTYPGGFWSFTYASKGLHPIKDFDPQKVKRSGLEFKYYNEQIHKGSFMLPQFMYDNVKEFLKDATDK